MNFQKCLVGSMYIAGLLGLGSLSWKMGQMTAQQEQSRDSLNARMVVAVEKASTFRRTESKSATLSNDTTAKKYYFEHIWEFQPLPHSPHERAKVWQQIQTAIHQKLATQES